MEELNPSLYTIAWIAPLEIEAQAALHMLDHRHNGRFPTSRGDDYVFRAGDINGHNIVVATLPAGQEYGTGSAAALASQIKKFFPNLWFGLLVGVAAGLPNLNKTPPIDIRLGDVIVGLPEGESAGLIAYDLGKETADGFQLLRFGRVLANTETVVRSAIGNIKVMAPYDSDVFLPFYETIKDKEHSKGTFTDPGQENDALYDVNNDSIETLVPRPKRDASRRTRVWYGPIGSGDKLTKNARKRNELRDRFGVIGLEMEAAGTMNRIPVGVIRGVCDYADEHKNKEWQPYAAAMAAAYAKAILHELGPGKAVSKQGNITPARHGTILCDLPPSTDRFFGRDKELSEMRTYLETSNQRKGVVLCGISGSGKTQLAREYVAQRGDQFSAVLWIDAGSEENIEQSMSSCASRICEGNPGFQKRRESTPPYQFIFEWLRTNSEKRWLVVVDNANDTIPNKRLLGPFHEMKHGALCVTSTQQVTARALRMKEMSVQRLDLLASQSLVLWRAYESDQDQTEEARDAARRVAKLLDGYPLALELAGSLHQRGITSLDEFSEIFAEEYPALAQFEIDSGAWSWTKAGASDSLFGILDTLYESLIARTPELAHLLTLCSIYGPQEIPISLLQGLELYDMNNTSGISNASKKLQSLVHSKVKLNKAIDELAKVFLVTKKQATDRSILGFSLHASICHWRFATMEDRDIWIIQAAYNLSRHISSGNATNDKYRFFNMFNRCLDAIWKHMEPCNIDPIHGEFASPYFTICSCGADMYLSMGKPYIAKKLFTAAIDYGRSSQASQISDHVILRLLNGLAECYEKMKQFEPAEEALLSATDMAERTLGHMDDLTVHLASRLRAVKDRIAVELENRKRVLVASTGGKLRQANSSSSSPLTTSSSTSRSDTRPLLPSLSWGILLAEPIVFLPGSDGDAAVNPTEATPYVRGKVTILAYETIKIESIFVVFRGQGRTFQLNRELEEDDDEDEEDDDEEEEEETLGTFFSRTRRLELSESGTKAWDTLYGNDCIYHLDRTGSSNQSNPSPQLSIGQDEMPGSMMKISESRTKRLHNGKYAERRHALSLPDCYEYSFEIAMDPCEPETAQAEHGFVDWSIDAFIKLSGVGPLSMLKEVPVVRIPPNRGVEATAPKHFFREWENQLWLQASLVDGIHAIGSKVPITITLNLLSPDLQVEYLSYAITQTEEYWAKDGQRTRELTTYKRVLLEKVAISTPIASRGSTDFNEAFDDKIFAEIRQRLYSEQPLPYLPLNEPVSIAEDLRLPTCRQTRQMMLGQVLKADCTLPCIEIKHFIQME